MNLNYFTEFIILAETRNYWDAAERLFINQSTLSKHIKAMEKELGVPLFDRTTRKVTLTEFGQTLLPYARSIIKSQTEYTAALTRKQNEHQGMITLGSISSMKRYHITELISDFQDAYPAYHVHVIENDSYRMKQILLNGRCELAFLREEANTLSSPALKTEDIISRIPYTEDQLVAVVPTSHPLSTSQCISISDLKQEQLCLPKKNTVLYNLIHSACETAGFIPNVFYDSHYTGSIVDMIVRNSCIGLMTKRQIEPMMAPERANPPAVISLPVTPEISTQISLCYLQEETLSDGAKAFVEFFRESLL